MLPIFLTAGLFTAFETFASEYIKEKGCHPDFLPDEGIVNYRGTGTGIEIPVLKRLNTN